MSKLIFCPLWPWKLTDDQLGTSSILHWALCIISNPSVKSNLSYSQETLHSGQNWWFFVPRDLEIWRLKLKNNRAPLLYYIELCVSFESQRWIQTGVTVRKRSIRVKIGNFFVPCDFQIWRMTLKNKMAPLLCCFKLCASFHGRFCKPRDLKLWRRTFKNNRAPLLSNIKLCASFLCHMWIQTAVTVRKRLNWVMTSVTSAIDLWPWPFASTSRLPMVITPENCRMIRWRENCQKGVTDGRIDGQMEISVLRAPWLQLKRGKVPHEVKHFYRNDLIV